MRGAELGAVPEGRVGTGGHPARAHLGSVSQCAWKIRCGTGVQGKAPPMGEGQRRSCGAAGGGGEGGGQGEALHRVLLGLDQARPFPVLGLFHTSAVTEPGTGRGGNGVYLKGLVRHRAPAVVGLHAPSCWWGEPQGHRAGCGGARTTAATWPLRSCRTGFLTFGL